MSNIVDQEIILAISKTLVVQHELEGVSYFKIINPTFSTSSLYN